MNNITYNKRKKEIEAECLCHSGRCSCGAQLEELEKEWNKVYMSQKMSTLDKKERNNIEDELGSKAAAMGMDMYESYGSSPEQKKLKELVGMCFNCNNLSYCASEFATVFAKCEAFNFKLSGQNRIVECNLHSPKGVLSLNEMYSIATLIDPEKENKVGFTAKPKSKGMKT